MPAEDFTSRPAEQHIPENKEITMHFPPIGTNLLRRDISRTSHLRQRMTTLTVLILVTLLSQSVTTNTLGADSKTRPNIVIIMADDKYDGPGAMAAKEADIPEKLASRPHMRITLNYVGFIWIQGN